MLKTELTGLPSLKPTEGLVRGSREAEHTAHTSNPHRLTHNLKGKSMQNRVTNFRCLIRTKTLLQVQYH